MDSATQIANPSVWAEYGGFAGLVVLALFAMIVFLMRQHGQERSEWRAEFQTSRTEIIESNRRMTDALEGLKDALRDSNRRG